VPVRAPVVVGENVTPTVHVALAAMLAPQLSLAIAKSPLEAMLENARATFWWLERVTDLTALVLPTATAPRFKLPGERVTGVCANADAPRPMRESQRTVLLKNSFDRCFAGLELELWK
jgi:hypothetical protein